MAPFEAAQYVTPKTTAQYYADTQVNEQHKTLLCYKLRVAVLASLNGQWYWAEYSGFGVGSEASGYALFVSGYSGNAGDAMTVDGDFANSLNSKRFRTYDRPFDRNGYCVLRLNWLGGFWYSSNTNCGYALLNQATYFYWISLPLGTRSSQYVALARSRMTLLPK